LLTEEHITHACQHAALQHVHWRTCVVRRTYSGYGDRCIAAARPKLWNSLPANLRQTDINFEQFKWLLKTFMFGRWDHSTLWLTVKLHLVSYLTYLLTYACTVASSMHYAELFQWLVSQFTIYQGYEWWPTKETLITTSSYKLEWYFLPAAEY